MTDKIDRFRAEIEACIAAQAAATTDAERLGAAQGEMDWLSALALVLDNTWMCADCRRLSVDAPIPAPDLGHCGEEPAPPVLICPACAVERTRPARGYDDWPTLDELADDSYNPAAVPVPPWEAE